MVVKPKRRYVAVKAEPEVPPEEVFKVIREKFAELFGLVGVAEADLRFYKFRDTAIIRCRLESLPKLLFSTAIVKEINGIPTVLRTIRISGTMRKLKEMG